MLSQAVTVAEPIKFDQSEALKFLPEGPSMMAADQLSWVGIQHGGDAEHGSINVLNLADGRNRSYDLPGRPGFAFATDREGVFVAGVERAVGLFDTANGNWEPFAEGIDSAVQGTIINDGLMFDGNLVFGTKDLQFATKKAGLYLYRGRDQKLIQLRSDQICSNGKVITRHEGDAVTMMDIDSPTQTIVRYELDVASGTLSDPTTVVDFAGTSGVPDGMTLTPDGKSLIVAIFNPSPAGHGETRMYGLHDGALQHVWITPGSPQNTCPAIVEHDGGVHLVITTAVEHMDDAARRACPSAGRLFIAPTPFDSVAAQPRWQCPRTGRVTS